MKQILIDFMQKQTRVGLVEQSKLVEIIIDELGSPGNVGNIFAGIVKKTLPNNFAFIDIGLAQNAFIDMNDGKEKIKLKNGQHVVVQVLKDGVAEKGANATTQISFSGKNVVVYCSDESGIGVSKKIEDKNERARLKAVARESLPEGYSLIVRTEAQGVSADGLRCEILRLAEFGRLTLERAQYVKAPALVYGESFLYSALEALMDDTVAEVVINKPDKLSEISGILNELGFSGETVKYKETKTLFEDYFVGSQFTEATRKKVWLKCGGYLIIEQTAACVVIDVNTGKFINNKSREKTVLKTNIEAAAEIARQIRLRNLSGMIIIDFIDIRGENDRCELRQVLEEELKKDRIRVDIVGMTELGLMQLTRKRLSRPLSEYFKKACPVCGAEIGEV